MIAIKFGSWKTGQVTGKGQLISEKITPFLVKIGNQKHLGSLRDGFAIITPLIIASAVAIVLLTSFFGGWGTEKSSLLGVFAKWDNSSFTVSSVNLQGENIQGMTAWGRTSSEATRVFEAMNNYGLGLIAVYFTFGFGFFLAKASGNNSPEIGGLVALGCFFIATAGGGQSTAKYIALNGDVNPLVSDYKGSSGIFTSIVTTLISVETYCWLSRIKVLELRLPQGVPPAVARSFAKLFPVIGSGILITIIFAVVAIPTHLTNAEMLTSQSSASSGVIIGVSEAAADSYYNLGDAIYMAIQSPFIYAATIEGANLGIAVFYTFLVSFFWFFGIHGSSVTNGIFNPVWLTLLATNASLLSQGGDVLASKGTIFVYGSFDAYVFFGGGGATLPFILGTLWFGKRATERAIAKFSIPAGIFNINEPVVFGYPIVANLLYAIPYILVPPILTATTWIFYQAFDTTYISVQLPWTAPVGIGALFATQFDWSSCVIAFINFGIAFFIWMPFTLISNRIKDEVPSVSKKISARGKETKAITELSEQE